MMIKKIPYYIGSAISLLKAVKIIESLELTLKYKNTILKFKNGLIFNIVNLLDILIIKETVIDDVYKLNNLINPGLIIDVGAAFGDFTIFAAKMFPSSQILCFEPDPVYFTLLKKNIILNKINNITCFNYAISCKKRYKLYMQANHGNSSYMKRKKYYQKISVKTKKLSDFITPQVKLLKIDCEGAELDILQSAADNKLSLVKNIALEYHNFTIPNMDNVIKQKLTKQGFSCTLKQDSYSPLYGYLYAEKID